MRPAGRASGTRGMAQGRNQCYDKGTEEEKRMTTATKLEKGYLLALLRAGNMVLAELQTNVKVLPSQYNANRKSLFVPPCRGKGVVKCG